MTQPSAWGESWYSSWGSSWGRKSLVDAMDRSGVTRLWMYQLYSDSIEKDLKDKQVKEESKPVLIKSKKVKPKKKIIKRLESIPIKKLRIKPSYVEPWILYKQPSNDILETVSYIIQKDNLQGFVSKVKNSFKLFEDNKVIEKRRIEKKQENEELWFLLVA